MANPLQNVSAQRKIRYFILLAVLFTVTIFWRGKIAPPILAQSTILAQSEQLDMREIEQGEEADLTGNAISLTLTGSRGLAVSALWWLATEKQKRHEWNELELLINSITKLQPHFITPWMFQAWNISYNVSVESDRLGDMYFYIARGIELLAEGERRNKNNPDLRWWIAFTYQNKFGVSDKVATLRCLYQLSCIPPEERDPKKLMTDDKVNMREFQAFCEKYPQLVRRLRETPIREKSGEHLCEDPKDVVAFLNDNRKVPNRYRDARELATGTKQFPVVPRRFDTGVEELQSDQPFTDGLADAFLASRAWYKYSLEPLPDPDREPIATPSIIPRGKRLPKKPALIIFRQGAPRAQSYLAERMQKEGWFDTEGWTVDKGYDLKAKWFPETTLVLGANQEWSRAAWSKAYDMWEAHGNANALLLSPAELDRYRRTAEPLVAYLKEQGQYDGNINLGSLNLRPEDSQNEELVNAIDAQRKLIYYDQNRSMTNFPFFLYSSGAERKKETVQARKTFYQADKIKQAGDIEAALKMYQQAFEQWKDVLATNESFHRPPGASTAVQEWSYERQVQYLELLRFWYGPRLREQEVKLLTALSAANVLDASPFSLIMTPEVLDKLGVDYRGRVPVAFAGPFDGIDRGGREPWISESVRTMVNARMNPNLSPTPQTPVPTTVGNP